jgi:hypothetical protein
MKNVVWFILGGGLVYWLTRDKKQPAMGAGSSSPETIPANTTVTMPIYDWHLDLLNLRANYEAAVKWLMERNFYEEYTHHMVLYIGQNPTADQAAQAQYINAINFAIGKGFPVPMAPPGAVAQGAPINQTTDATSTTTAPVSDVMSSTPAVSNFSGNQDVVRNQSFR